MASADAGAHRSDTLGATAVNSAAGGGASSSRNVFVIRFDFILFLLVLSLPPAPLLSLSTITLSYTLLFPVFSSLFCNCFLLSLIVSPCSIMVLSCSVFVCPFLFVSIRFSGPELITGPGP